MHTQEDRLLTEDVRRALVAHVNYPGDITVTVEQGIVILDGTVADEMEHHDALFAARSVYGVKDVVDRLRFDDDDAQSVGEYVDDALITAAVKANLISEAGIKSLLISVETNQGVVTLSGDVKKAEQIRLAEHTAKMTNGVKSVNNRLVYKP